MKIYKTGLSALLLFLFAAVSCSQEEDLIDTYALNTPCAEDHLSISGMMSLNNGWTDGNAQQSIAVFDKWAFVIGEKGYCHIIDLTAKTVANSLRLASFGSSNHANNACFGTVRYLDGDDFPLLYISQWGQQQCFVERYSDEGLFELVQTIRVEIGREGNRLSDFAIDQTDNLLYEMVYDRSRDSVVTIRSFYIPTQDTDSVVLRETDLLGEREVHLGSEHILQGVYAYDGRIFLLYGGESDRDRGLFIIHMNSGECEQHDFSYFKAEPEGLAFYNHSLIMNTNGKGIYYVYHFKWP